MKWSVLVATALIACSQGGLTGKAPAQAILDGRLDQGDGNQCAVPGSMIMLGDFNQTTSVADGANGNTSIGCTVHDNGNSAFEVHAEIKVAGESLLVVAGTVPGTYDKAANPNGIPGLHASFRTYGENDSACLLQYRTDAQGAAGGRIWGHLTCPRAAPGPLDAGDATKTCTATAQLRFENCGF